jgi:hypothetical protein
MLTSRSFILIHHVGEMQTDGKQGRFYRVAFRTEFSDRSDAYTLTAAATDHVRQYAPELLTQPVNKAS